MRKIEIFECHDSKGAVARVNDFIRDSGGRYTLINASTTIYDTGLEFWPHRYVTTVVYDDGENIQNNI